MRLLNTLSGKVETVVPLSPHELTMYACGPTTYDNVHLGNVRTSVVFDTLARVLRTEFDVNYVTNFTDVDDKILNKAKQELVWPTEVSEKVIAAIEADWDKLNVRPDRVVKVTDSMHIIQEMVDKLLAKGFAYKADNGDILFDLSKSPATPFSHVRNADAQDFALWKKQDPNYWGVPYQHGFGRPGWHIECSAMIRRYLGETIDIHGGGMDLKFPHHENEIHQSVAANGKPLATMFVHSGMVTVNGAKMSKSLGNHIVFRDLNYDPRVIRFDLLRTKYNQVYDFTYDRLEESKKIYAKLTSVDAELEPVPEDVLQLLRNDFNTPVAIMKLQQYAKAKKYGAVKAGLNLLGVL